MPDKSARVVSAVPTPEEQPAATANGLSHEIRHATRLTTRLKVLIGTAIAIFVAGVLVERYAASKEYVDKAVKKLEDGHDTQVKQVQDLAREVSAVGATVQSTARKVDSLDLKLDALIANPPVMRAAEPRPHR